MSPEYESWPYAVLVAIDQLGNAIAGGHPDATISARVGFFARNAKRFKPYWRCLEAVIDFSFYPVDGPKHCFQAWQADKDRKFQHGSDVARIILSFFIFVACPIIAILLRVAVLFIPAWHYSHQDEAT